jgi:hypothetical protein
MPHAYRKPALSEVHVRLPLTFPGTPRFTVVPLPSAPEELDPQHQAAAPDAMPQLDAAPTPFANDSSET